jgi:hypothetical protein
VRWHRNYDVEGSPLRTRLELVRRHVREALDAVAPDRSPRILSLCAGRGADVIDVLADHPRRESTRARLVELDPELAEHARTSAAALGLDGVEVVTGDASDSSVAAGIAPAHVVVACGIFGNISDDDIHAFVDFVPALCAPRATVVWTRHRRPPDLTLRIRDWFAAAGFDEIDFDAPDPAAVVGVGAHRLVAPPARFVTGHRMFSFVGDGSLA